MESKGKIAQNFASWIIIRLIKVEFDKVYMYI